MFMRKVALELNANHKNLCVCVRINRGTLWRNYVAAADTRGDM